MVFKRLLVEVSKQRPKLGLAKSLYTRSYITSQKLRSDAAYKLPNGQRRLQSSYVGSFARKFRDRDADGSTNAAYLRELYHRNDPEAVIRLFESQPSLHTNPAALKEYVKTLVKVDRLDESELLRTSQRGMASSSNSTFEEESIGGLSAFKNVGKSTKEGVLGTAAAPIHMVATEGGHFKEQLWRTVRALGMGFLLISGVGALIEDRGITKGLGLHDEVQPSMESNTKFSDVKGVDEAKAELEEIVYYLRDPKILKADDVDLAVIARGTPGFSGADLANLVNVAALKAAKDGAKSVSMSDLEFAKDKIMMGSERKSAVISDDVRKLTAYHEGGHALVAIYTEGAHPVHKATIVPRGMALGMVAQLPEKDETSVSRKEMLARLDVCMGGRVAEELIFGEDEVTSGASSDLVKATHLARAMVTKYGMSKEVGVVAHDYDDNGKSMSTETRLLIEKEVRELLERAYNNAKHILTTHSNEHHALANALLEHETLSGKQIKEMLAQLKSEPNKQQQHAQLKSQSTPNAAVAAAAAAASAASAAAKAKGVAPVGS